MNTVYDKLCADLAGKFAAQKVMMNQLLNDVKVAATEAVKVHGHAATAAYEDITDDLRVIIAKMTEFETFFDANENL